MARSDAARTEVFGAVPGARRFAAVVALLCMVLTLAAAIYFLVDNLALVVVVELVVVAGLVGSFTAVTSRGARRLLGTAVAVAGLAGVLAILVATNVLRAIAVLALLAVAAAYATRKALGVDAPTTVSDRPAAPRAKRAVVFMNPVSGGGKVTKFRLDDAARELGAEVVVLEPPFDLRELAQQAVADGADLLGVAGGDGSQAIVAEVAGEHDVAFLCIPAGTRNHFALDLGLDRSDPTLALAALVDGVDERIDLAFVGDRVFVNNVSLGVYAKVVQSPEYRDAKLGTFATQLPELVGPDAAPFDLHLDGPHGRLDGPQLVQISNNAYRFDSLSAFGTRSELDRGVLGVVAATVASAADAADLVRVAATGSPERFHGWHHWTTDRLEVWAESGSIEAGVDGEALVLDSPLVLRSWPGAVRVRLPRRRRGPLPPAVRINRTTVVRLARLAAQGVDPKTVDALERRPSHTSPSMGRPADGG